MAPREVLRLPIGEIGELRPDEYVGLIDETAVECLKARLQAENLLTPIWVRQNGNRSKTGPYSVIAGRHRLRAAKALGWSHIDAEVRAGSNSTAEELQRLQLVENLDRRALRPIERALNIMVRWRAEAGDGELDTVSKERADESTAQVCGLDTARTVRRYRRLYDEIVVPFKDQFALINAHPLGESFRAMTELAKIKDKVGRAVAIETLLSREDWKSINEVLVAAGVHGSNGNRVDQRNHHAVLLHTFEKMKLREKRKYLDELPGVLTKDMAMSLVVNLQRKFKL